jgi:hypothetical protein
MIQANFLQKVFAVIVSVTGFFLDESNNMKQLNNMK